MIVAKQLSKRSQAGGSRASNPMPNYAPSMGAALSYYTLIFYRALIG